MGFTLTKKPRYKEILVCGTSADNDFEFWAKFRVLNQEEYKQLTERTQKESEEDPVGTCHGMIPLAAELMIEFVNRKDDPARWLVDEEDTSKPLEFTEARKLELLQQEGVAHAVVTCYEMSRYNTEAVVGNFNASRKSGRGRIQPAARSEPRTK